MRWISKDFTELTPDELYAVIALRQQVFVVEQTCAYLDADGRDPECHHLWAETGGDALPEGSRSGASAVNDQRVVLAYLRIVPAGQRFAEVSIGRVVTAPQARGAGLGRALMQRGLARVRERYGAVPVCISAQAHLERFYGELGFVRTSANFDEDGIPHLKMRRGQRVGRSARGQPSSRNLLAGARARPPGAAFARPRVAPGCRTPSRRWRLRG